MNTNSVLNQIYSAIGIKQSPEKSQELASITYRKDNGRTCPDQSITGDVAAAKQEHSRTQKNTKSSEQINPDAHKKAS